LEFGIGEGVRRGGGGEGVDFDRVEEKFITTHLL